MTLRVSTLTTVDQLRGLEREWLALLGRADADLPFLFPEWVVSWWEVFRQQRSVIRDSLHVKAVRRESGELVAVVPLMVTERPAVGPARVRTIGFLGADKYVTEQRAPIVDRGCESEVAAALAADLGRDGSWRWIAWEGLQRESELAKGLGQVMELRWASHQAGNILQLEPSWVAFRGKLKRNIKESLRHCYNSLRREGLTAHLDVATTPEQIASALEIFFDLHANRARQANEVSHQDRFANPSARRFLMLACSRFAARNITRVFTLRIGGVPVASRVGFRLSGCLYLYYSGFDPAWRKYSVATTLVAEAIKYAIDCGVPRAHLSMGADSSKSRWGPTMPVFHAAVCVQPDLYSRAALRLYSWGRAQTGLVKRLLGRGFD
jgi:CelD/BcsL family acetyltransferase involved in cellulose biosynthesis